MSQLPDNKHRHEIRFRMTSGQTDIELTSAGLGLVAFVLVFVIGVGVFSVGRAYGYW